MKQSSVIPVYIFFSVVLYECLHWADIGAKPLMERLLLLAPSRLNACSDGHFCIAKCK